MAALASKSPEDILTWEAENRIRAGIAAIAAAALLVASFIVGGAAFRDSPSVTVWSGLRDAAGTPPADGGLLTATALKWHDNAGLLVTNGVLAALGALAMGVALAFLFVSTRARQPSLRQIFLVGVAIGAVGYGVGTAVAAIAPVISISDFVSGADHSTAAAHDAVKPSAALAAGTIQFFGLLFLLISIVLVSLNAMRVGLLTRFMGIMGLLVAGLTVIAQFQLTPIIVFWLVALGALFLGRWPNGMPPAWDTGRAEPWPSRQQMIEEARAKQQAEKGGPDVVEGRATEADEPDRPAHSRSKKKKRRR